MDPVIAFCIKHQNCDVSFFRDGFSGDLNHVKIDMCMVVDHVPYRAARVVGEYDSVSQVLDDMYADIVNLIRKGSDLNERIRRKKHL